MSGFFAQIYTLEEFRKNIAAGIAASHIVPRLWTQVVGHHGEVALAWSRRTSGIIDSMTKTEREYPSLSLEEGRRRRIARGAGVSTGEVNMVVQQFTYVETIMGEIERRQPRDGLA
jgi:signal recognition particle GTPase